MLDYKMVKDDKGFEWIETELRGKELLTTYLLNKGTAFTYEERCALELLGKLPARIETLEEQIVRAYRQYKKYRSDLQRHIYLNNMHDKNEVLFFKLVTEHLAEMLPIIYTPIVGQAVKNFSHEYRQPRGLYISYPDQDKIDFILSNRTHPEISIIVVTDGERVLGIGDQGVGAIGIPIAKLILYTMCGGINPYHTLPILLDVGTNNEKLLKDPLYLGWRNRRIRGEEYDRFIERFVTAVKQHFPNSLLHWEDFGRDNARRILEKYRQDLCTFNDDMQGTAVVALAALLNAVKRLKSNLSSQRVVILGAGTAGVGIADVIVEGMNREGLSLSDARERIWLVDKEGLLTKGVEEIMLFQVPYVRKEGQKLSLEELVNEVKPTVLIGCSSATGAFTESIVRNMAAFTERPIIFPLSNPNEKAEASPFDLLVWTGGKALIATGSPFNGQFAQCNNAFSFPGIGLGLVASKATRLTDSMLWEAVKTLCSCAPSEDNSPLLPELSQARDVAYKIALAVTKDACRSGFSKLPIEDCEKAVQETLWEPYYRPIRPISNLAKRG